MEIKKRELLNLWYIFESFQNAKPSVKFSYFIAKNKIKIKDEVDALHEVQKISDEFKLYDKKRADLASVMADREPDTDKPIIDNNQYIIKKNKEKFDEELRDLRVEFFETIKKREEQIDIVNDILNETTEFNGYKTRLEDIPENTEPAIIEMFVITNLIAE